MGEFCVWSRAFVLTHFGNPLKFVGVCYLVLVLLQIHGSVCCGGYILICLWIFRLNGAHLSWHFSKHWARIIHPSIVYRLWSPMIPPSCAVAIVWIAAIYCTLIDFYCDWFPWRKIILCDAEMDPFGSTQPAYLLGLIMTEICAFSRMIAFNIFSLGRLRKQLPLHNLGGNVNKAIYYYYYFGWARCTWAFHSMWE